MIGAPRSSVFYRDLHRRPITIVSGEGAYLQAADGRRYLDANASAGVVAIGHGRTEIAEALVAAGKAISFVYSGAFTHPAQESLARALIDIAPKNMAAVYLVSGGSEANESAWKLARQYFVERGQTQKYKAIARHPSYHGVTLAALSLSGRPSWRHIYSPLLLPVAQIPAPYDYRCTHCAARGSCSLECADDLEKTIEREGPKTVAAFFAEPIVGTSAPGVVPHRDYYPRIREICDRYEVLFVADEVLCGYGRTGAPFALSAWSVEPDIITMGKGLSSGYAPLGAMIVSEKIASQLETASGRFVHGLTFSGTPSACLTGLEVNRIMHREGLFRRAAEIGKRLFGGLAQLASDCPQIGEIRGRGLLAGVEFVADRETRRPFSANVQFAVMVAGKMRDDGVLVGLGIACGPSGEHVDHIQISPPLIIGESEVDRIVDALRNALRSMPKDNLAA